MFLLFQENVQFHTYTAWSKKKKFVSIAEMSGKIYEKLKLRRLLKDSPSTKPSEQTSNFPRICFFCKSFPSYAAFFV